MLEVINPFKKEEEHSNSDETTNEELDAHENATDEDLDNPSRRIFMKKAGAVVAGAIAMSALPPSINDASAKCRKRKQCGPNHEPNIGKYSGDRNIEKMIKVKICHPDWDKLKSSSSQGKWWDFEIGGEKKSVRVVHSKCTSQSVAPGTTIRLAKCTGRGVWTGKARQNGRKIKFH